jgi:hypothetical protein
LISAATGPPNPPPPRRSRLNRCHIRLIDHFTNCLISLTILRLVGFGRIVHHNRVWIRPQGLPGSGAAIRFGRHDRPLDCSAEYTRGEGDWCRDSAALGQNAPLKPSQQTLPPRIFWASFGHPLGCLKDDLNYRQTRREKGTITLFLDDNRQRGVLHRRAWLRCGCGFRCSIYQGTWQQSRPETVVKTCERRHDGQPVQERKVAANDQTELKQHHNDTRYAPGLARIKGKPRRDQFREEIEQDAGLQYPVRQEVKPAAQRTWNRLGLEVIIQRGQIAPAGVAAQFDERCAHHDAEDEPVE